MDVIKRVRAARGAVNMSLEDFADAVGIGRQTLVRIENGSRVPRDHEYAKMAAVSGLPPAFFYADLNAVLEGHETPTLASQVAEHDRQIKELLVSFAALGADNARLQQELKAILDRDRRMGPEEEDR